MITLPNQQTRVLTHINDGDILGDLRTSFNLNLTDNRGAIRLNRSKLSFSDADDADMGIPMAIAQFDYDNDLSSEYVIATETGGIFLGDVNPSDSFTEDTKTGTPSLAIRDRIDMAVFNNKLYVTDTTNISDLAKGASSWSNTKGSLTTGLHILLPYADRMYYTDVNGTAIFSFDTSEVFSTTSFTLDLSGFKNLKIMCMCAAEESIWVGTINKAGDQATIFEWDGATEDTPRAKYTIDTYGVLSCVIWRGLPYFMDVEGRLLGFDGRAFVPVSRLPLDEDKPFYDLSGQFSSTLTDRDAYIRHNGMAIVNGRINILIKGNYEDNGATQDVNVPSGIWEYDEQVKGLYHKISASFSSNSDTGVSNLTDHGQFKLSNVGALVYASSGNSDSDRNGTYLFGANYFSDATTVKSGLFIDDSIDTTQKWGFFTTNKLFSVGIEDSWQKIYVVYKLLLDSADKIVVKYKTTEDVELQATITWTDSNTFTTTTNVSAYVVGDEVQIIQGTGSGKSAHIKAISESGGTYTVDLDETFTGASGTALAFFEKWKKAGKALQTEKKQWKSIATALKNQSPWIRFKVSMQFTGEDEIYKLRIINKTTINE